MHPLRSISPDSDETSTEQLLRETLDTMGRTVAAQVAAAIRAFQQRDGAAARAVRIKDGYVDNLNSQAQILSQQIDARGNRRLARCAWTMAVNLEHIGDYAVNVAKQYAFRRCDTAPRHTNRLETYRKHVARGLGLALRAFATPSMERAFAACNEEAELDRLYAEDLERLLQEMVHGGDQAREALTWAFVVKNLERMGDMVLNLGEAVLSMLCGERLKLEHLRSIERMLPASSFTVQGMWGGVSGAFVGLVEREGDVSLYKGGPQDMIGREHENLVRWEALAPGAPPRVLRAPDDGSSGLLMERIEGPTLEDALLRQNGDVPALMEKVLGFFEGVWGGTRGPAEGPSGFVAQIRERLPELFDVHPHLAKLRNRSRVFGPLAFPSLGEMLADAETRELELLSPCSVFLHGDLNLNNVILPDDRVRVVDVHRSGQGDLAQDVSVLMVSCVRHPLALGPAAARARAAYRIIRERGAAHARALGDTTFDKRLELALARSYITSGRVQRDADHATILFLKGIQYLEAFLCVR